MLSIVTSRIQAGDNRKKGGESVKTLASVTSVGRSRALLQKNICAKTILSKEIWMPSSPFGRIKNKTVAF